MNNHQRRLRAIEVTLTPQQIVALWLRNAQQAGTFEEAVRQSPFPREAIANAILKTVRAGMRGLPRASDPTRHIAGPSGRRLAVPAHGSSKRGGSRKQSLQPA